MGCGNNNNTGGGGGGGTKIPGAEGPTNTRSGGKGGSTSAGEGSSGRSGAGGGGWGSSGGSSGHAGKAGGRAIDSDYKLPTLTGTGTRYGATFQDNRAFGELLFPIESLSGQTLTNFNVVSSAAGSNTAADPITRIWWGDNTNFDLGTGSKTKSHTYS